MKVKLYMPFYDYNDGDFDTDENFYKNDAEYFNAMQKSVEQTSRAVEAGMNNYMNGGSVGGYKSSDGQTYRFANKTSVSEDKVSYAECDAVLYGEDGNDRSVDDFIADYVSKDVQLYILKLDLDTSDEDFEQEINLWDIEHKKIQNYTKIKGEDWVFDNEPKRNIKLKFTNNANEEKFAILVNCKIMEKQNMNIYIILAEEINLIDKIQ